MQGPYSQIEHLQVINENGKSFDEGEISVDQYGFPGDSQDVDLNIIYEQISRILKHAGIVWTVSGDDVLNYFKAPKLITDLQICISETDIEIASRAFTAEREFCFPFKPAKGSWQSLLAAFPRFKLSGVNCFFTIVPTTFYDFGPLSPDKFVASPSRKYFPVLRLKYYVSAASQRIILPETDSEARSWWGMMLEFLIDGMDIDDVWCRRNLELGPATDVVIARSTRARKHDRIGRKYTEGMFTCYIHDEEERSLVLQVPGRD